MEIKTYTPQYKQQCLEAFKSNMPKYFMDEEYPLFEKWLDEVALDGRYYVILENDQVLGCGGYFYHQSYKKAGLSWGLVDSKLHGKGIGSILTKFRIQKMMEEFPELEHMIDTSQHTAPFYEKMGFVTKEITPNGFGPGLDKYYMELKR